MIRKIIDKINKAWIKSQNKKIKIQLRKVHKKNIHMLMDQNKESELIIKHYGGYDRGGLILISYDISQLKDLKESLEGRNLQCELLEDYVGGYRCFKFSLTPEYKEEKDIEECINDFLKFCNIYFVNGRPIPSYDFFNEKEKEILKRWW